MSIKSFINTLVQAKDKAVTKVLDPRDEYINNPNYQETPTVGGAVYNTTKGAENFVKGLTQLPGQIYTGITHPSQGGEMLVNTAKNYSEYLNNLVGQPVTVKDGQVGLQVPSIMHAAKTVYDDPLNAALTVVTGKDIVKPKVNGSSIPKTPTTISETNGVNKINPPEKTITIIPDEEINAFKSQYTIPTKRARAGDLDLTGTSREILDHIKSGMKINPEEAPALVTGQNGLSTKLTNQIIDNITSPINVSDIASAAKEILDKNKTAVSAARRKAIISDINSGVNPSSFSNYITGSGINEGMINGMKATDALALSRQLDALSSQYSRQSTYLTPNVESEIIAKSFSAAADRIMSKINESAVKDGAITKLDQPSIISEANNISPLYAQRITEALADPTSPLSKVRSTAAPFVRYQKIIDMTKDAKNSVGGKMADKLMPNQPTINLGGAKTSAKEILQNAIGFPGKIVGEGIDTTINALKPKTPINDFSKPWEKQLSRTGGLKLPGADSILKVGGYISPKDGSNQSGNTPEQNSNPESTNINQNNQNNPDHNGIISQPGRYTIDLPQTKGFITGDDYTNNANQLTQQIAQANASGDTVTATKLAGQKTQLDNTWTQQAPIRDTATKVNTFAGLANNAYDALKNYNVSILNLNGSFDSLMQGGDPNAAAAATALQAIKDQTGLDFSHYKTKETLMAALDTAFKQQTNLLNAQNQQFFGGNTLNAGGTTTNNNTVQSIPQIEDNTQLGKPVDYNFNFGTAGQGLPARPH